MRKIKILYVNRFSILLYGLNSSEYKILYKELNEDGHYLYRTKNYIHILYGDTGHIVNILSNNKIINNKNVVIEYYNYELDDRKNTVPF